MKRLSDIPILSMAAFDRLAALAPKDHSGDPAGTKTKKTKSKDTSRSTLGPLKLAEYLDHYGQQYKVKQRGGRTLYQIDCLFNPDHHSPDSYIQQDSDGKIIYVCSHNSCSHYRWEDAREKISGKDSLASYCEGYDPQKAKQGSPAKEEEGKKSFAYLTFTDKGRPIFNSSIMGDYLSDYYDPVLNEGEEWGSLFYRYHKTGLWKKLTRAEIGHFCDIRLGAYGDPSKIDNAIKMFAHKALKLPEQRAVNTMELNLINCMLNVKTGETTPHSPLHYSTTQLPVIYQVGAKCEMWIQSLIEIFVDDTEKITVLQEFFGYCLYPKIIFPCALFQIGGGANGKGLVQKVLEAMLGEENVSHISLQRMEDKFGIIEIKDKLLNASGETSTKPIEVNRFKEVAVADRIQAERKYLPDIIFIPFAKHMISMNEFPGVKDKTDGFFRRVIVMEYNQKFEGDEDDTSLAEKIIEKELDGIFMWSLEGLKRVLERGRMFLPDCVLLAKQRFKTKVNHILLFVEEECIIDEELSEAPPDLFNAYLEWAKESNITSTYGKKNFYEQIRLNFKVIKGRDGTREVYKGIGLRLDHLLK